MCIVLVFDSFYDLLPRSLSLRLQPAGTWTQLHRRLGAQARHLEICIRRSLLYSMGFQLGQCAYRGPCCEPSSLDNLNWQRPTCSLFGITIRQAYEYYTTPSNDPIVQKLIVSFFRIVDFFELLTFGFRLAWSGEFWVISILNGDTDTDWPSSACWTRSTLYSQCSWCILSSSRR